MSKKNIDFVSEEIAIEEIKKLTSKWSLNEYSDDQIKSNFPQTIKAISLGLLVVDESSIPHLNLKEGITNDEGGIFLDKITFKTRVKPSDLANITKNLNVSQNQYEFALRVLAHCIGQPKAILDKLSKFDYKVSEELVNIFL